MKYQSDDPTTNQIAGYQRNHNPQQTKQITPYGPTKPCPTHQHIIQMCKEQPRTDKEIANEIYGGYENLTKHGIIALIDWGLISHNGTHYQCTPKCQQLT